MTVYNFNMGIGWASSGVEYAQYYRSLAFDYLDVDAKFIFTDLILNENIQTLTSNMGFKDQQVIWLYQAFSDLPIETSSYRLDQVLAQYVQQPIRFERAANIIRYYFNEQGDFLTCYLKKGTEDIVDRAEFVSRNCLIRKDYYASQLYLSEYYVPKDNQAKVRCRQFYNQDGSISLTEIIDEDKSIYRIDQEIFYSKAELVGYFILNLSLTEQDILLIDRSADIAEPIFRYHGPAKVGVIVHADHFSEPNTTDQRILWNNYYEYQFMNVEEVDFIVCATRPQSQLLANQFWHYYQKKPLIYTIPVGNLLTLKSNHNTRQPYALITASRLAKEKHIDLIIEAVVQARRQIPQLRLDIYGEGGERSSLEELIKAKHGQDYIHLKGHQDLNDIYQYYQAYVSASMSEGFGLTLMEAIGSGLAMIGFDVRYGNQNFIRPQENGYLLALGDKSRPYFIDQLSQAIIQLFSVDLPQMQARSYQLAEEFTLERVAGMWQDLIKEVIHA
ncbi:accessory Sec system glycosyltransferase GtfA [Ignavigranum ruoffiae]|uniref:accessory Sec system glycosyltransferase GtfA n=1 Tax=Ignavigranum ruoffiae TaxID=89093 RepID=UPI003B009D1B